MATIQDVNDLFDRIRLIEARLVATAGPGSSGTAEVPDFGIQTYQVTGMKSPEDLEDDIATLSIWVWNLRDHLKVVLASQARTRWISSDSLIPITTSKCARI